jgi:hypothetical protein
VFFWISFVPTGASPDSEFLTKLGEKCSGSQDRSVVLRPEFCDATVDTRKCAVLKTCPTSVLKKRFLVLNHAIESIAIFSVSFTTSQEFLFTVNIIERTTAQNLLLPFFPPLLK